MDQDHGAAFHQSTEFDVICDLLVQRHLDLIRDQTPWVMKRSLWQEVLDADLILSGALIVLSPDLGRQMLAGALAGVDNSIQLERQTSESRPRDGSRVRRASGRDLLDLFCVTNLITGAARAFPNHRICDL